MLNGIAKKTVLAFMIGANIASMTTDAYAGSKSSSRSSYSSSSYSSSSRSSYSAAPSSSSYSSSSRSSYTSSTPSKTAVYTPVTKATAPKPAPFKQDTKKAAATPKSSTTSNKVAGQSYSDIKKSKTKGSSNFLTWVLLAWILSDSNKSSASTSTTKEVVVDCKQWLKDNAQKPSALSNDGYQKIKKYCESVTK